MLCTLEVSSERLRYRVGSAVKVRTSSAEIDEVSFDIPSLKEYYSIRDILPEASSPTPRVGYDKRQSRPLSLFTSS